MVFDHPPHANHEVTMYFLRKLWVEFELGLKHNYFDIRSFQGVGGGMPQDRLGAKLNNNTRNDIHPQPLVPLPIPVVPMPLCHRAMSSTLTSLSALLGNLVDYQMQVIHIRPLGHVCTSFGGICRGPQGDVDAAYDVDVDASQDGHDAKGATFDDEAYATHSGGGDDIDVDVESFFDLLYHEEGEIQEQQVKFYIMYIIIYFLHIYIIVLTILMCVEF